MSQRGPAYVEGAVALSQAYDLPARLRQVARTRAARSRPYAPGRKGKVKAFCRGAGPAYEKYQATVFLGG